MDPDWVLITDNNDIKIGDYIRGTTYTYAQKWLMYDGYEIYNRSIEGHVVKTGTELLDIKIKNNDAINYACADPGSSGGYYIQKYTGNKVT